MVTYSLVPFIYRLLESVSGAVYLEFRLTNKAYKRALINSTFILYNPALEIGGGCKWTII
jgi:hypothetical protein